MGLNYQLLDPEEPTLASQDKLKVSPEGLPFVNIEVSFDHTSLNSNAYIHDVLLRL